MNASGGKSNAASEMDERRRKVSSMGIWLFIIALGILFAASVAGYLVVRARSAVWPPAGSPELPVGLWLSTVVILFSSVTIQFALYSIRQDRRWGLKLGLVLTCLLGIAFLVSQYFNWLELFRANITPATPSLYSFSFYFLTGLHGLHVLGGLAALFIVTARAFLDGYNSSSHTGVQHTAIYWHFLDFVWLVLFTVLFLV